MEAGLDAGIEEDQIGGPLAGVRNQRCIAALDHPVRVSGIERLYVAVALFERFSFWWRPSRPGNGIQIEVFQLVVG